jgi:hypothetical protein
MGDNTGIARTNREKRRHRTMTEKTDVERLLEGLDFETDPDPDFAPLAKDLVRFARWLDPMDDFEALAKKALEYTGE